MSSCFATEDKPDIFFSSSLYRLQVREIKFQKDSLLPGTIFQILDGGFYLFLASSSYIYLGIVSQ